MMLGQQFRRTNEFDNFINNIPSQNKLHSPRDIQNIRPYTDNPLKSERNQSPNKIFATKKPMISPTRPLRINFASERQVPTMQFTNRNDVKFNSPNNFNGNAKRQFNELFCGNVNHQNKIAEYLISIDGDQLPYCALCAQQAASQGFKVIEISALKHGKHQKSGNKQLPHYPQYVNNKYYQEIIHFLKGMNAVEERTTQIFEKFETTDSHYTHQIKITQSFYDELLEIVSQMKNDHIEDLYKQKQKYEHNCRLDESEIKPHLAEFDSIRDDLNENIVQIVQNQNLIAEETLKNTLAEYRRAIDFVSFKLEEYTEKFTEMTSYKESSLTSKVKKVEDFLMNLWEEHLPQNKESSKVIQMHNFQQPKAAMTVKNVHDLLPQQDLHHQEEKAAFRNLFDNEEDEERIPETTSPQFKVI